MYENYVPFMVRVYTYIFIYIICNRGRGPYSKTWRAMGWTSLIYIWSLRVNVTSWQTRYKKKEDQPCSLCSVLISKKSPLRFLVYSNIIFIKSVVFGQLVSADVTREASSCARRQVSSGGNVSIDICYNHEDVNVS